MPGSSRVPGAGSSLDRYIEQIGMLLRGFDGFHQGMPQTITFPPLKDLHAGGEPINLNATSDSGLPVEYYVAYGPVKVVDDNLLPAEIPARASFPGE